MGIEKGKVVPFSTRKATGRVARCSNCTDRVQDIIDTSAVVQPGFCITVFRERIKLLGYYLDAIAEDAASSPTRCSQLQGLLQRARRHIPPASLNELRAMVLTSQQSFWERNPAYYMVIIERIALALAKLSTQHGPSSPR